MASIRIRRVEDQVHQALARIMIQGSSDPRFELLTVTRVRMTTDLKLARVFISHLTGREQGRESFLVLCRAKGYLKRELARLVPLRYTPELEFIYDDGMEHAQHIYDLIDGLKLEDGEENPAAADEPEADSAVDNDR